MSFTVVRNAGGEVVGVDRLADGARIPIAPGNRDYQAFLVWNAQQAEPDDLLTHTPPGWPGWAAFNLAQWRLLAKALLDGDPSGLLKLLRAVALLTMDELNILRQWLTSFKAEVAAATSLADLKTRVAGLPNTPDRSKEQLYNKIKTRVDGGEGD